MVGTDKKYSRIYTKRVGGDEFLFAKLEKNGELVEVQLYRYARIFIKKIDENNEGLFIKQKKDGQLVEVRIS